MKPISTKTKEFALYGFTLFSGIVFAACIWIMANDYRPLVADAEWGKQLNSQLYEKLECNFSSTKQMLAHMGQNFTLCYSSVPKYDVPSIKVDRAIEELVELGQSLLIVH